MAISKQRSTPQAASTHQEIRIAWVMLLLEDKATYGYELRRQLAWHRLKVDPAGVYRTLRQLERDGWVQSRWMRPASGPRRRLYRLTPAGRHNLDELAGVIDDMRDTHDRFLRAYHRALRDRLASDPDSDEPPTE